MTKKHSETVRTPISTVRTESGKLRRGWRYFPFFQLMPSDMYIPGVLHTDHRDIIGLLVTVGVRIHIPVHSITKRSGKIRLLAYKSIFQNYIIQYSEAFYNLDLYLLQV